MPLIRKGSGEQPLAPAPRGSESLDSVLRNGTADERWVAVRLARAGDAETLGRALSSEADDRVREAIFTSLARLHDAGSVDAVLPYLRADDAKLRTGALDALRAMPEAVRPKLQALLSDTDCDVRLLACEIVRELSGPFAPRLLCDLLETEREANVCGAAVEVLAEIGGPEAIPVLERCATRFGDVPFLVFSIKAASDRLGVRSPGQT